VHGTCNETANKQIDKTISDAAKLCGNRYLTQKAYGSTLILGLTALKQDTRIERSYRLDRKTISQSACSEQQQNVKFY